MSEELVSWLVAALAEDFDIEVVERTPGNARVELRMSEAQRQAMFSRVITARAEIANAEWDTQRAAGSAAPVAPEPGTNLHL